MADDKTQYNAEHLDDLKRRAVADLNACGAANDLEVWRARYLGRSGALTAVLRSLGGVADIKERARLGQRANQLKSELEGALEEWRAQFGAVKTDGADANFDASLDGTRPPSGGYHISTLTIRKILRIFGEMGFQALAGPEIEEARYNFDMLNIPADHPARALMDTIWVKGANGAERLLRTHTSPMQARAMQSAPPPIRIVAAGKCYRHEATDASHDWQFHQVEGVAVGRGITFANLKWVLEQFAKRMFGEERRVRLRCDYFPFVEPGVDVSIDCFICESAGCRLCKHTGWIEIMGAGMTHPNVLRGVGYDPDEVSGFAFGLGPERIAMLKHGIDDIRLFFENDLRFLAQFANGAEV